MSHNIHCTTYNYPTPLRTKVLSDDVYVYIGYKRISSLLLFSQI